MSYKIALEYYGVTVSVVLQDLERHNYLPLVAIILGGHCK